MLIFCQNGFQESKPDRVPRCEALHDCGTQPLSCAVPAV